MTDEVDHTRPKSAEEWQAYRSMARLLALETPEDAEKIEAALEEGWQADVSASFGRAARKVFGMPPLYG